uniref:Uncharacterized protein n=1 Tax=Zea mays TaxID=4577 RepID=C0P5S7_MAIZE|nr:unknown [Zea mays]ACN28478.1 unknown [Zea mays]
MPARTSTQNQLLPQQRQELQRRRRQHQRGGARAPAERRHGRRPRLDLYGEVAGGGGGVGLGGQRKALEVAGLVLLVLRLVVRVERVRRVAGDVHAAARGAVPQRRAVGERAGVVDVGAEPAEVLGSGVQRAPRPGQVRHAARRHQRRVPALPREVHGELGLAVVPQHAPVALEVARRDALGVLVDEPEQVHLRRALARPRRRAGVRRQPPQQARVEALRVGRLGVPVAVRGPPHLAHDHRHVAVPHGPQRRHQRVEVGVEHVGVQHAVVVHWRRAAVEEGVVQREVLVQVQAQERVDVHGEGRAVPSQEPHHVRHQPRDVGAEPPRRRNRVAPRGVVHVGVQRHGRLDPVADPGVVQSVLDVLQRRERDVDEGPVVRLQERLVADGHVLDGDAAVEVVAPDVVLDPVPGLAGVGGQAREHGVGDGDHDLDAGAGERAHGGGVGIEQLHLLDAVVPEHLHHGLGRQRVRRLRAPVHPQRRRRPHRAGAEQHRRREPRRHPHGTAVRASWSRREPLGPPDWVANEWTDFGAGLYCTVATVAGEDASGILGRSSSGSRN